MKRQRIVDYVENLNIEQLRFICVHAIEFMVDAEYVSYSEDSECFYWDNTGDNIEEMGE